MNHDSDSNIVPEDKTFILAGYTIPCNGTVVAWEFCYRISTVSVTFYPGIWRTRTRSNGKRDYTLIQSSSITYDSSIQTDGDDSCWRVNLLAEDQFIAPEGSIVGLYSNSGQMYSQLLHTNINSSITTYKFSGNQSRVTTVDNKKDVEYNIAIKVHLGK